MKRRHFLGAMLAAASAPAIVKADNLMKIVVPKQEIKLLNQNGISGAYVGDLDISSQYTYIGQQFEIYDTEGPHRPSLITPNDNIEQALDRRARAVKGMAAEYDFFLRRPTGFQNLPAPQAALVREQFMRRYHPEYAKTVYQ